MADSRSPDIPHPSESLGARIARLRLERSMTQQELAERVAISRVALSNLESGRSVPGERTITLLAGVFDSEPHDLIAGTAYPVAKADRLPLAVARYTRSQMLEALCLRDLRWIEGAPVAVARRVLEEWRAEIAAAIRSTADPSERDRLERLLGLLGSTDSA